MRVHDGDHARVSFPSIPHFCHTGSLVTTRPSIRMYACRFCSDVLATCGDTGSSSSARVFALLISAVKHLATSRPNLLGVSAQMHGVGVPASGSRSHRHSHHIVTEMGTAASATASNVVRIISTEAGLSVHTAEMKVQWCVSPTNILPMSCQLFLVPVFFLLASIRQMSRWHAMHRLTLRRPRRVSLPSLQNPRVQPNPYVHRTPRP